VQSGAPEALFAAPANELVARSLGIRNILAGVVAPGVGALSVTCAIGTIGATGPASMSDDGGVLAMIDERGMTISRDGDGLREAGTILAGVVLTRDFRGGESEVHVAIGEGELICIVPSGQAGMAIGDAVSVAIPRAAVRLLQSVAGA
jgi:ABC-type Fe3+/spermidine/putrescine transport system ATPase subunit